MTHNNAHAVSNTTQRPRRAPEHASQKVSHLRLRLWARRKQATHLRHCGGYQAVLHYVQINLTRAKLHVVVSQSSTVQQNEEQNHGRQEEHTPHGQTASSTHYKVGLDAAQLWVMLLDRFADWMI